MSNVQEVNTSEGDALRSMVTGNDSPSTTNANFETSNDPLGTNGNPETQKTSNLEDIERLNLEATPEAPSELETPESIEDLLEFKVKGFDDPVKLPKDINDLKVQEYINKGIRFDKKMAELSGQQKELQKQLDAVKDYKEKSAMADKITQAQKLLDQGHSEYAISTLLGDKAEGILEALVSQRQAYASASPEDRLSMDMDKERRSQSLQKQRDADHIAKLEAQINTRSAQVRETEFSGYIQEAKERYDLKQFIDSGDDAVGLNEMLHSTAMQDVIKEQRRRETSSMPDVSQRDIRRIYAQRAKQLVGHSRRTSRLAQEQATAAQSQVNATNAQVTPSVSAPATKQNDAVDQWKKTGGSMTDLLAMMRRR